MLNANKHPTRKTPNTLNLKKGDTACVDTKPIAILLIEDVKSDAILTRAALKEACHPHNIDVNVIQKGDEVMPYLLEKDTPQPDLIVLDLGLPGLSGQDVLKQLEGAPTSVRAVPIIILSGNYATNTHLPNGKIWIPASIKKPCSVEDIQVALKNTPLLSTFSLPTQTNMESHRLSPDYSQPAPSKVAHANRKAVIANDQSPNTENDNLARTQSTDPMRFMFIGALPILILSAFALYTPPSKPPLDFTSADYTTPEKQATLERLMKHDPDFLASQLNNIEPTE